jgi:hypothetical protein
MAMRRVGRHRRAIGVQTAEKGRNEVEAGGIDEQNSLAGSAQTLQVSCDGAGTLIQPGVCQNGLMGRTIEQMNKCRLIRSFLRLIAERFDQIVRNLMQTAMRFFVN